MFQRLFHQLALATVCLGVVSVPAFSLDERTVCSQVEKIAAILNAGGPKMVDAVTRFDAIVVQCEAKTMNWVKFINRRKSEYKIELFESHVQATLNSLCEESGYRALISGGWTLSQTTTFKDGFRSFIKAKCK